MNSERRFLSKRELARDLNISVYTVDAWVSQRRELPFVRMGRRVLFDVKDVQAWIEKNRMRPE